jgi:hypothetical protein
MPGVLAFKRFKARSKALSHSQFIRLGFFHHCHPTFGTSPLSFDFAAY